MAAAKKVSEKKEEEKAQNNDCNTLDALLKKENALADDMNGDLVNNLLEKCEVKGFSEIYLKTAAENDGIFSQKKLFNFNKIFTAERVRNDIASISDLLLVSLIDPKPLKKELSYRKIQGAKFSANISKDKMESGKDLYIINKEGLKRILMLYRKRRIFSPILEISNLITEFELEKQKLPILIQMITELVEEKQIYADLIEGVSEDRMDIKIVFKSKLSDAENRKRLIMIFALTGVLFLFLILYQILISIVLPQ